MERLIPHSKCTQLFSLNDLKVYDTLRQLHIFLIQHF